MRVPRPRWLLATALLASSLALPAAAAAQEYTADVCTKNADSGLTFAADPGSSGFTNANFCHGPAMAIHQKVDLTTASGGVQWTLNAPAGTIIRSLEVAEMETSSSWNTNVNWSLKADGKAIDSIHGPSVPGKGGRLYSNVDATSLTGRLACDTSPCAVTGSTPLINLYGLVAKFDDVVQPSATVGPGLATASLRGTVDVPYHAADEGAGVAVTVLMVDGAQQTVTEHDNGGLCHQPFRSVTPCLASIDGSFPLDTTKLSEGQHELKVSVFDGSGRHAESAPVTVTVQNTVPPGTGGGGDGGGDGGQAGGGGQGGTKPVISALKLSRKRFAVGKGTVLRLASSEAARLTLTIERLAPHRKPRRVGKLSLAVKAGANRVAFKGRLGRRSLKPGRYRMTVSARSGAGAESAPARLPFAILPR